MPEWPVWVDGNTDDAQRLKDKKATISNVVRFRDSYMRPAGERPTPMGEHYYYITGAGENDPHFGWVPFTDGGNGLSVPSRTYFLINRLFQYLDHLQDLAVSGTTVELDMIGFSRGAASARVFVNAVQEICQKVSAWRTGALLMWRI